MKTQALGKMRLRTKGLYCPFQEIRLQKREGLDLRSMFLGLLMEHKVLAKCNLIHRPHTYGGAMYY